MNDDEPLILISAEARGLVDDGPVNATDRAVEPAVEPIGDRDTSSSGAPPTDFSQLAEETEVPAPVDSPAPSKLDEIYGELASLHAETAHANAIIDRLHAENERLRRGETEQLLQPLFRDLIKLVDDWTAMASAWQTRDSATPQDVANKCAEIADDAGLILARFGVDSFRPEPGTPVERRQHRAVGTAPTDEAELDGSIAHVRRTGFIYGDKVIRFAEVVVYKHAT